jgi:hypothetical protein
LDFLIEVMALLPIRSLLVDPIDDYGLKTASEGAVHSVGQLDPP